MAGINLMSTTALGPRAGSPAVQPADPLSPGGQDQSAGREISRASSEAYAPRGNEIIRSDAVGLEQPPRSPSNPRLREWMLGGFGQPSTINNTSSPIPAPKEEVAEIVDREKEDDDLPPWEYIRLPRRIKDAWECLQQMSYRACVMQTQCSCVFVVFSFVVVGIIIGVGMVLMPMKVETSLDSFLKTDVESSILYETWNVWYKLLADRNRNQNYRLLQDGTEVIKDVILLYKLKRGDLPGGIANVNCLHDIASFEQGIRALPRWQEFCGLAEASGNNALCDPGLSFAGYGLPTLITDTGNFLPTSLTFDGKGWARGWEPLPEKTAIFLAAKHDVGSLLFEKSFNVEADEVVTHARSAFRFRVQGSDGQKLNQEWENFCKDVLMPLLQRGMHSEMVEMYYDGTGFEQWEVLQAMWQDISWAIGAVVFVIIYLVFHTRSIILSILGLISALLSLPLSYLVCALLGGTTTVSFASALMIFLLIGFGCDMILVYTDFWRDSVQVKDKYVDRLVWTYRHGGAASLATTSVTALSFFANLASVIRALRQIGFFMGLCVSIAWLLVTAIYVPSCLMDERFQRKVFRRKVGRGMPGRSLRERALKKWGLHLQRWHWLYLILPTVAVIVGLILAAVNLDFNFESPNIFSDDHHHQLFKDIEEKFEPLSTSFGKSFVGPPLNEPVCTKDLRDPILRTCKIVWCDASLRVSLNSTLSCDCVRRKKVCTPRSGSAQDGMTNTTDISEATDEELNITTTVRWVGAGPTEFDLEAASKLLATIEGGSISPSSRSEQAFEGAASCEAEVMPGQLLLQDWASGQSDFAPMVRCEGLAPRSDADKSICSWEDRCYCSKFACQENLQWKALPRLILSPLPSSRRLLTQATAAKVRVIFGIQIDVKVPMLGELDPATGWDFLQTFDVEQPWGQRNLNAFCSELTSDLEVERDWCWMKEFRIWHSDKYQRFPTRKDMFIPRLNEFLQAEQYSPFGSYMWWNDEQTRIKATYFSYMLGVQKEPSSNIALRLKKAWDRYVKNFDAQASSYASGAIVVSKLWVDPEAEEELLSSSISTIIVLVVLAFWGMLLFTFSITLSIFVVLVTLGVIASLMFFLVMIANWTVGLVEGVALIYFVGYAVTYALHITHKYGTGGEVTRSLVISDEDLTNQRLTRTIHALTSIGGSVLGSATTTAGASLFLVPCTLVIFKRLGMMCLIVTLCSILAAFGPLPAGLLICGPQRPGRGLSKTMAFLWRSTRICRQRCQSCMRELHYHLTKPNPEENPPWSPSERKSVDLTNFAKSPGDSSSKKKSKGEANQVNLPRSGADDSPTSRSQSSTSRSAGPSRDATFEDVLGSDSEPKS